jgi:sulfhydrogenase subunit beta (sulfur reductase)
MAETMLKTLLGVAGLGALLDALVARGYELVGPTVRDGAVVLARIDGVADLPHGVGDEQGPGRYRLTGTDDERCFGFAATSTSWKSFLFPARRTLWRTGADGTPVPEPPAGTRRALVGVRSCDLHALEILDAVLAQRGAVDPDYFERRRSAFVVAVTCGTPGGTCFCASMGSGPRSDGGFDIALTELLDGGSHRFLAEAGTGDGAEVLAGLPGRPASPADVAGREQVVDAAVAAMGRHVDTRDIRDLLYVSADSPVWDDVADRCLACASCTMACPTCFCVTTVDPLPVLEPSGRDRVWDSCFTNGHSVLHGQPLRGSTKARYRQWLTHKFASWQDQFGTSGCVGCGRCITWCPVGIDVTAELAALRGGEDG